MELEELVGIYRVIGKNQNDSDLSYTGILELQLDEDERILAKWVIHGDQKQQGTGFFKDNILVINFNYLGEDGQTYKGVVVYRCLTTDLLDGFWSEKHGDPRYLGEERCFRLKQAAVN